MTVKRRLILFKPHWDSSFSSTFFCFLKISRILEKKKVQRLKALIKYLKIRNFKPCLNFSEIFFFFLLLWGKKKKRNSGQLRKTFKFLWNIFSLPSIWEKKPKTNSGQHRKKLNIFFCIELGTYCIIFIQHLILCLFVLKWENIAWYFFIFLQRNREWMGTASSFSCDVENKARNKGQHCFLQKWQSELGFLYYSSF